VYPGLYVADASIVPTALGSNPLLTITALSERIAELIVSDPRHVALFRPEP
jgi:cholesterol oxidase